MDLQHKQRLQQHHRLGADMPLHSGQGAPAADDKPNVSAAVYDSSVDNKKQRSISPERVPRLAAPVVPTSADNTAGLTTQPRVGGVKRRIAR